MTSTLCSKFREKNPDSWMQAVYVLKEHRVPCWMTSFCSKAIKNNFTQWCREDWWQSIKKSQDVKKGREFNVAIVEGNEFLNWIIWMANDHFHRNMPDIQLVQTFFQPVDLLFCDTLSNAFDLIKCWKIIIYKATLWIEQHYMILCNNNGRSRHEIRLAIVCCFYTNGPGLHFENGPSN